jgi:hypothetical protein
MITRKRLLEARKPLVNEIHSHLPLVPKVSIGPPLPRNNRQVGRGLAPLPTPFLVVEFGRMASKVQANDEVDSLHHQGFQKPLVTEFPVQKKGTLPKKLFNGTKGLEVIQVTR